jgi:hypothetical protein
VNGDRLDLSRRRSLGALLSSTFEVYRANPLTVLASTGAIVLVVEVIVAIGLGQITGHYQVKPKQSATVVQLLASLFVLTPLINAMMALMLLELSEGRQPAPLQAIQRGLDVFAPTLVAVVLWAAAVVAGSLLILPAIYFLITWYFATQAVAIEGRRGFGALMRSGELVSGSWFRVLGTLIAITVVGGVVPVLVLGLAVDAIARAANAELIVVVGNILVETASLSFVALAAALLFFDLRAAKSPGAPVRAGR